MNVGGALTGGILGALLGSAVWIGIGYATGYELGILAIGVGLACGVGVASGTKGQAGPQGGVIAALLAIAAILGARYVIVQMSVSEWIREASAESMPGAHDDEYWVAYIADRMIVDLERAGADINWPSEDETFGDAASSYPSDVWAEAQQNWNSFSQGEKEQFCGAAAKMSANEMAEFRGVMGFVAFLFTCFHPMSLLILALAVGTAYKTAAHATPMEGDGSSIDDGTNTVSGNVPGLPGLPAGPAVAAPASPPAGRAVPPRPAAKNPTPTTFSDASNRSPLDRYAPPPSR